MQILRTIELNGRIIRLDSYEPEPVGLLKMGRRRPAGEAPRRPPGAGRFEIGEIDVSLDAAGLTVRTRVSGTNIAYIFAEVLLKDVDLGRYYGPVVREHIQAAHRRETRGVERPVWDDPVECAATVQPGLRVLTDGVDSSFCFTVPEGYGSLHRRLSCLYRRARSGAPLRAALTFDPAGELAGAVAYQERRGRFLPRAFVPGPGDQVSPFVEVLMPPAGEKSEDCGEWRVETALSTTLTFGDEPLHVVTEWLGPGDYIAGVVVQDLDGGFTRRYAL